MSGYLRSRYPWTEYARIWYPEAGYPWARKIHLGTLGLGLTKLGHYTYMAWSSLLMRRLVKLMI